MGKLYVTITIDTENSQGAIISGRWTKDTMLGFCQGKNYGIRYILKMFEQYNISATWYLSIFEKSIFGEKLIADICNLLMDHNQDIQLHTHPVWLMDSQGKKRINMYQYSLEDQIYMMDKGIQDIYKLTGRKPIAHRAGGYGVNRDTFTAMKECGIKIDSSIFYQNPNCKVNTRRGRNGIYEFMDLVEFPISVYELHTDYLIPYKKDCRSIQKIDINFSREDEIINSYKQALKHGGGYLNLFMHSGSFYRFFGKEVKSINDVTHKNDIVVERFHNVMRYINNTPDIEVITVPELYEKVLRQEVSKRDYLPVLQQKYFSRMGKKSYEKK